MRFSNEEKPAEMHKIWLVRGSKTSMKNHQILRNKHHAHLKLDNAHPCPSSKESMLIVSALAP